MIAQLASLGVDAEQVQPISIVVLTAARAAIRAVESDEDKRDRMLVVCGAALTARVRPDDRRIPLVVFNALMSRAGGGVAFDLKAIPKMGGEQVFEIVRPLLAVEATRVRRF